MADIYHKILVPYGSTEQKELLIAWLNFYGAEAIVEEDDRLEAYTKDDPKSLIENVRTTGQITAEELVIEKIEDKNWNAEWEENFDPVTIGKVYIRAPFHEPAQKGMVDLVIAPKMAFGTGHHATTNMMIEEMSLLEFEGKNVLDYGCGTGILSVYAKLLGAQHISGVDIQPESMDNSWEQVELNKLNKSNFTFKLGFLEEFEGQKFDLILANINRHVLLDKAEEIFKYLESGGSLLISGILVKDRKKIVKAYQTAGFILDKENERDEWCWFLFSPES